MHEYSEDALVEQPAIALLRDTLGWEALNCYDETLGAEHGALGRETYAEVVLVRRLRAALVRLNPGASREALDLAIEELARDRSGQSLAQANRAIYRLLKDDVKLRLRAESGDDDHAAGDGQRAESIKVIDWEHPERNDFFLASQFWVAGDLYKRRADLVGFVNGLPLVFIELKATHKRLRAAYDGNLRAYKTDIPQLFWYNALVILSNGSQTRLGSLTAGWEHFFEWKKISDEEERGVVSLETTLRGVCEKTRLLDLVENFTLYNDAGGALTKILAKNHQYLGVNRALAAVRELRDNPASQEGAGRLGVFWHTQGSGKSYSMVFFTQKILRTLAGAWTFLIVTDRDDLDGQIYKTFAAVGAVTDREREIQAQSGAHLQDLLRADHRVLFTLIQKFHVERGTIYPTISARSDIIVITDEAHRSQYDSLALNMRNALPRAAFIAFTGTPLMKVGEEKTRDVFGDYVSVYNFRQSVEDGATVPLYYENRVPELQLTNGAFDDEMQALVEAAELDDEQERLLERQFAREYHLITRDDRLEKVAADLVAHFMERGHYGKAMVVSIDKATAVRMYDKAQVHWRMYLERLRLRLASAPEEERASLRKRIAMMEATDMAVVVSQAQNEIADFHDKGLDIEPHRRRMVKEDLETKFKDADDPLCIVFVCAMWMTGFDAPSVSTIYLDKPMRNHTLMQTIARANRVFGDKVNGLIVDYVGIFRDLQKALALYGASQPGAAEDDLPIKDKAALVAQLDTALTEAEVFSAAHGVTLAPILEAPGFQRIALLDDAVDTLLVNDETKLRYLALAAGVARLYRAILPDPGANAYTARVAALAVIASKIKALLPPADITELMGEIDKLLDSSIAAEAYVIRGGQAIAEGGAAYAVDRRVDLSKIDFDALREHFARARKHTEAEKLRGAISTKIGRMVRLNRTRASYQARLQQLIADYNAGSVNVEVFFDQLVKLAQELTVEDQRAIREQVSEEELAVYDLLTREEVALSDREREQVKRVASDLLATLKREKLTLDWKKRQQTRAQVRETVEKALDTGLPAAYSTDLYQRASDAVYQHLYDAYLDADHSVYAQASL